MCVIVCLNIVWVNGYCVALMVALLLYARAKFLNGNANLNHPQVLTSYGTINNIKYLGEIRIIP